MACEADSEAAQRENTTGSGSASREPRLLGQIRNQSLLLLLADGRAPGFAAEKSTSSGKFGMNFPLQWLRPCGIATENPGQQRLNTLNNH